MSECPLCQRKKLTKWYYQDDVCTIVDCITCKTPMCIFNFHRKPTKEELKHMMDKAFELFDMQVYTFDFNMRQHPLHMHFHLRKFNK